MNNSERAKQFMPFDALKGLKEALKEKAGVSSRCMPFEQEKLSDKCICCGRPAKKMVYWGKAY